MAEILTTHGEKLELIKIFKTSYPTVRAALRGTSNSELSKKIRKAAIERGAVEKNSK